MSVSINIVDCTSPTNPNISLCTVGFEATTTVVVSEGGTADVRVVRGPEAYGPLSVAWELVPITASIADFGAARMSGVLRFAAEERLKVRALGS